jgi:hypothetical protein
MRLFVALVLWFLRAVLKSRGSLALENLAPPAAARHLRSQAEVSPTQARGAGLLGSAVHDLAGLALTAAVRKAGNGDRVAPTRIPTVLAVEVRQARSAAHSRRAHRLDSPYQHRPARGWPGSSSRFGKRRSGARPLGFSRTTMTGSLASSMTAGRVARKAAATAAVWTSGWRTLWASRAFPSPTARRMRIRTSNA